MKKLFSMMTAMILTLGVMHAEDVQYFCKVAQSWWTADGAAVAAYAWAGEGESAVANAAWPGVRMTPVEGDETLWSIALNPSKYEKVIFVRVSGEGELKDWGAQTVDLAIPKDEKVLYTISSDKPTWSGEGNRVEGAWSDPSAVEPDPDPDPDPEVAKFYITGDAAFVTAAGLDKAKAWDPKAIAASDDEVTLALEADQEYQMKITVDGTWDTAKGYSNLTRKPDGITTNDDDNIIFTLAEGESALAVTFNATKFLVAGKFKVATVDPEVLYYIAGSMTDWQENKIAVSSNPYTLSLKAGDYQLKVIDGEAWKGFDDLTTVTEGLSSDKDGNICFTLAEDGEVVVSYSAAEFIVTGKFKVATVEPEVKFYITGDAALVGEDLAWKADAIPVKDDGYVFTALPAGDYKLKVTLKGAWEPASDVLGFDALTTVTEGLTKDGDGNICFTLKEAGDVKVVYSVVDGEVAFRVEGKFYVKPDEPEPTVNFYITGSKELVGEDKAWDPKAIASTEDSYTFKALAAGDYALKLTLDGTWDTALGFDNLTEVADGLTKGENNNILFTLDEESDVTVTYTTDKDGFKASFKLEGKFKVATVDPEKALFYITGDSAFVVDAGLDKSKQWAPDAIPVTKEDIYPINLKGEQEYQFKITLDGTWATAKGFDDLKHQEDFPGPYRADKDNIAFKLTEDAEVRIKYNEGDFKIESEKFFVETVEPTAKFFITGDAALVGEDKAWKADAIAVEADSYTFKALPAGDYKLKVTLKGAWEPASDVLGYDALTEVANGLTKDDDGNICFTLKEEDDVVVTYALGGTGEVVFKLEGHFYVKPDEPEDPTVQFYLTGDSALVVDLGLDKEQAWNPKAIAVKEDFFILKGLKTDQEYNLKVVDLKGNWLGYEALTKVPAGVKAGENYNINFKVAEGGEVKLIFALGEDGGRIFTLEGGIYVEPTVDPEDVKFYITGSKELVGEEKAWKADAIAVEEDSYTFKALPAGDYKLKVTLKGAWEPASDVLGFDALTEVAKGLSADGDGNICFTLEEAGDVKVTYALGEDGKVVFKLEGNFKVETIDPETKFFITGDAALVGKDLAWNPKAIAVTEDQYTFKDLAEGEYKMKITVDGTWSTAKGFADLTDPDENLKGDADGNIVFYLAETGDVTVSYTEEAFRLDGNFATKTVDPEIKYYIAGTMTDWADNKIAVKDIRYQLSLEAGDHKLKLVTVDGDWLGYEALSDKPEGVTTDGDGNICFTLKEAGIVDISYDGKIFVIHGDFYVKPADELSVAAKGAWDDWGLALNFEVAKDKKTAALTVPLVKGAYEFKLLVNDEWRSNGYEFHRDFVGAAGITANLEANMVLQADVDGEYTLTWTFENDSLGIVFPEKEEPVIEKVILYIVLNIDWEKVYAYAWSEEAKNAEWPGVELLKFLGVSDKPVPSRVRAALQEDKVVYAYECPKEYANIIFNNGVDEQTADLTWEEKKPVFVIDDEKNGEGKYDGEWVTTEEAKIPTAINFVTDGDKAVKVLYNGNLYIIKGDKVYNVQGQLVQ